MAGLLALILLPIPDERLEWALTVTLTLLSNRSESSGITPKLPREWRSSAKHCDSRPPERFALMAAIAAVHAEAPTWDATDWIEIVGLYDTLHYRVALTHRRSQSCSRRWFRLGPQAGLDAIDELATGPTLAAYSYLSSSRAEFLRQLERHSDAALAFEEALAFCDNQVERIFVG